MSKSQQCAFSIKNNYSNCHVLLKYQHIEEFREFKIGMFSINKPGLICVTPNKKMCFYNLGISLKYHLLK